MKLRPSPNKVCVYVVVAHRPKVRDARMGPPIWARRSVEVWFGTLLQGW